MAIPKITGNPFANISSWSWERDKIIVPNPLKPKETKIIVGGENANDFNKLAKTLIGFYDKINVIIDEVNDLGRRVTKNENDITVLDNKLMRIDNQLKLKSTATHMHATGTGPSGPPMGRKGGSVKKMQPGGRTTPVPTGIEDFKQKLIDDIKQLQQEQNNAYTFK